MDVVKFYSYGFLSNFLCFMGLLGNTLTLYILNSNKDMRKPSINIYLTVLAIYDNGVLIFSVLMLNIPAITDYQHQQQQQQQQQQEQIILALAAANNFTNTTTSHYGNSNNSNNSGQTIAMNKSLGELPPLSQSHHSVVFTSAATTAQSSFIPPITPAVKPVIYLRNLLNDTLDDLITFCLVPPPKNSNSSFSETNSTWPSPSSPVNNKWLYCGLYYHIQNYMVDGTFNFTSNDNNISIIKRNSQCEMMLNETLMILDHFQQYGLIPSQSQVARLKRLLGGSQFLSDSSSCESQCSIITTSDGRLMEKQSITVLFISPLVYYVKFVYPLALISQTGSIWTTCLITIERYLAVCHPLWTKTLSTRTRAIWALSLLSVGAVVFNLPRFAEVDTTCYQVRATDLRRDKIYYKVYYIFLNLSLNYIIPLSLLSALNVKIYATVRRASAYRNELTRARQSELHMASMLVAIVAIFIACNAPAFVVNCLEPYFEVGTPVLELMTISSNVLVCFNSSVNFVIYCIFGRKFRQKFCGLFQFNNRHVNHANSPTTHRSTAMNGSRRYRWPNKYSHTGAGDDVSPGCSLATNWNGADDDASAAGTGTGAGDVIALPLIASSDERKPWTSNNYHKHDDHTLMNSNINAAQHNLNNSDDNSNNNNNGDDNNDRIIPSSQMEKENERQISFMDKKNENEMISNDQQQHHPPITLELKQKQSASGENFDKASHMMNFKKDNNSSKQKQESSTTENNGNGKVESIELPITIQQNHGGKSQLKVTTTTTITDVTESSSNYLLSCWPNSTSYSNSSLFRTVSYQLKPPEKSSASIASSSASSSLSVSGPIDPNISNKMGSSDTHSNDNNNEDELSTLLNKQPNINHIAHTHKDTLV